MMKKKILSYVLAVCMLVTMIPTMLSLAAEPAKVRIISAQSSSFIFPPANAINGSYADMYSSGIESNPWIMLEMDGYYDCTKIDLVSRGDFVGFPIDFTIQYSTNGVDWLTAPGGVIKDYPMPTQQHNEFEFTETITAKYVRIQTDKSYNDGANDLTQFGEIEIYGTPATTSNPDADQEYSVDFVGSTNGKWFQFENMQRESYYLSGAFYVPYYLNPIVGEMNGKSPSILYAGDKWVMVYEGADGIYCTTSQDDQIAGSWEYPYRLIAKGSYDKLSAPSIATDGTDIYIAFTATKGEQSKIAVVPYTVGSKTVSFSDSNVVTINSMSGTNPRVPSLMYDNAWKLYYTADVSGDRAMFAAQASAAPTAFTQTAAIANAKEGNVVKLKEGYALLFKSYTTEGECSTEWAYSEDGVSFDRRSVLLDRIMMENSSYYNSGAASVAIDDKGIIRGVVAESWKDDPAASFVTLYLPQRKATLGYQLFTINDSVAISPSVQAVFTERDYTVTDRVCVFEMPNSKPKHEKRKATALGSSLFLRSMENPGILPNSAVQFNTNLPEDLKIIRPVTAYADDYIDDSKSGEMVVDYYDKTYWQTNSIFTVDQPPHTVTIQLSGKHSIDAIQMKLINNGMAVPKDFYFEYSDDGENWKRMPGMTFVNYPVVSTGDVNLICPSPVKASYVRMTITRYETDASNTASVQISKLYFMSRDVLGADEYIYKEAGEEETWDYKDGKKLQKVDAVEATASSYLDGWLPEKAIDGEDSAWSSAPIDKRDTEDWLQIDLGKSYLIGRVELKQRSDNLVFPIDFHIQYSEDGTTWKDAPGGSVEGYQTPRTGFHNYVTFTSPVNARYLRAVFTKKRLDGAMYMAHISEFEAHEVVD